MPPHRPSVFLEKLVASRNGGPQQSVVNELRRVVLNGDVPPGTPVPLSEVADLLGVSHIPVREALKTLTGEGLVTHRPNAGYSVAQLTAQELREMYIVGESLEAAALAVSVHRATEEDRAAAVAANQRLAQAIIDGDGAAYQRESRNFHMALARPSGMQRLLRMLDMAWNMIEPVQPMVHVDSDHWTKLNIDHDEMLVAFLARDSERLLAATTRHAHRLNDVIATFPSDTGLLAEDETSQLD
ncbi:GntR family transcriptional regulator [Mycobacterium sp. OTB74]|jgi:DNA-binding GntR family transcriptional regulator|uniref:GntR family transcriptional regulator n=1 Tax=Mycobacterium sp. OTB74 TaxID=1853452 RepID=UPI0024758512|nr:GntR family transcriptional regulator [Mycobacterium sp. OTB74]MDH6243097.1 DNA-binding GntR family transcriptional regulator [Mycobacterium sp. OTB74]